MFWWQRRRVEAGLPSMAGQPPGGGLTPPPPAGQLHDATWPAPSEGWGSPSPHVPMLNRPLTLPSPKVFTATLASRLGRVASGREFYFWQGACISTAGILASVLPDPPRPGVERHPGSPACHAVGHVARLHVVCHVVWLQIHMPTSWGYMHLRIKCTCLPSRHRTPMRTMAFTHHPYHPSMMVT